MLKNTLLLAIGIVAVVTLTAMVDSSAVRAPGAEPDVLTAGEKVRLVGESIAGIVREVTAYNVGVRAQTSDTPCIGAGGRDLCELVDRGLKVCAANFVPLGAKLKIEKYGECIVMDRMHRRHAHRVDIAMREEEIEQAREFGIQRRVVAVKY